MKSLSLFALVITLPLVSVASAEDEKPAQLRARHNAAAGNFQARVVNQPRAIARGQNRLSNFNSGAAASTRNFRMQRAATYNSDLRVLPRTRPIISQTRTIQPVPPLVSPNILPAVTPNGRGINAWRKRSNGNWSGNDNGVGNRDWQNHQGRRGGGRHETWHAQHAGDPNFAQEHSRWHRHHENRSWWRSRYNRFALFGGGYYYWNSGCWYPAYGYDPYFSTYSYDAPIYAYNNLEPGQVIASVQTELLRRGYNPGGVDGEFGPATRGALLDYQQDNGLPVTGEIDEATLEALGLR